MLEGIAHFCGALNGNEGLFFKRSSPAIVKVSRTIGTVDQGRHIAFGDLAVNTYG